MSWKWPQFIEKGKELFKYLTNNFDEMFNNDGTIKHFTIRDDRDGYDEIIEEIMNKYGEEIELDLRSWIINEKENTRLFDSSLWKPFYNMYNIIDMYFGYKKLFQFKQYYFQLIIEDYCNTDYNTFGFCKYCHTPNSKFTTSFILLLYGWKEDTSEKLQPYDKYVISSDNLMPEKDWNINLFK